MARNKSLEFWLKNRYRSPRDLSLLIREQRNRSLNTSKLRSRRSDQFKGVYNGHYYRIPSQKAQKSSRPVPQIPLTFASPFCAFQPVVAKSRSTAKTPWQQIWNDPKRLDEFWEDFWWRSREWWKQNWSTVLMNMGSICTLVAFTRSDVLELRAFSMTGSISAVIYNASQNPVRWPTVMWSSTFALVNLVKITEILVERKSTVQLDDDQELIYNKFFMPHGITPKQFQLIYQRAQIVHLKKGDCLVQKGEKYRNVYLIVDGWTRANIAGRYLTAVSISPQLHESRGGASGAWIGEISFLNMYGRKQQEKLGSSAANQKQASPTVETTESSSTDDPGEKDNPPVSVAPKRYSRDHEAGLGYALYSVVAKEDSTVMVWSHEEMESLMGKSTDMRSALTRALTSAIVGKVVNFTVSRTKALPTWSSWLDDWKYSAGADVQVRPDSDGVVENLPLPKNLIQNKALN